jgi:hypothetical protein
MCNPFTTTYLYTYLGGSWNALSGSCRATKEASIAASRAIWRDASPERGEL